MRGDIEKISDTELLGRLADLAKNDRNTQVELLLHLAELDTRKLYLGVGYGSMWDYCRQALKFSEGMAHKRIAAARAFGKAPAAIPMLRDGRLSLCTLAALGPHLDKSGGEDLLERSAGRSKREVEVMAVSLAAKVEAAASKIPVVAPLELAFIAVPKSPNLEQTAPLPEIVAAPTPKARPIIRPVSPTTHRVAFTADTKVVENLERLRRLLGMTSIDDVVLQATEALLDRVDPARRHARRTARRTQTAKAKSRDTKTVSRYVSKAVADAANVESGGQCTHVSPSGQRCSATTFLEVDHIQPFALGGRSNPENIRILCAAHNQSRARETFGTVGR